MEERERTDEGFGDGDETQDVEFVLGEVEHFKRAIAFEDLGNKCNSSLRGSECSVKEGDGTGVHGDRYQGER
jgi:hypothetical protein